MAEYDERLAKADQYRALFETLLAKYVLRSDRGLLIANLRDGGPHLVVWEREADAAQFLADKQLTDTALQSYAVQTFPLHLIRDFVADNRDLSVLWHQSAEKQTSLTAQSFIAATDSMVKATEAEVARILHPSTGDHCIQLLERKRQSGLKIENANLQCPVTCPLCGHSFTMLEPVYRAWRDGEIEFATCNACQKEFKEAPFSTIPCSQCDQASGQMPPALCAYFSPANPYVCIDCQSRAITDQFQARQQRTQPANETGCLVVLGPFVSSLFLALYFILRSYP